MQLSPIKLVDRFQTEPWTIQVTGLVHKPQTLDLFQLIRQIPLRRVGQPEDLADAIVFLASEQARWITGQLLYVHGGHRMAMGR